jgi:2-desacetyl-2-hydroxyethyl bacteriochlorophyllide A dehydrogenase
LVVSSVWFAGPRQVELRTEAQDRLGPEDVRVQALASGISHGTEMLVFRGQVPEGMELDLPTLRGSFAFPIKYGYASVGRIVEVGPEVRRLHVGETVFVLHPHQTEYVVPEAMTVRLPAGLSPELGIFVANLETATNVVLDAAPRLGERVIVFGQGTVGLLITQLLKRTGAGQVVVVDPLARRRHLAEQLGADIVYAPGVSLSGMDFDLAIEVSGNANALDQALTSVAFGGTVVVCSWYGTKPVPLLLGGPFHRRRLRIVSSQVGTIDAALQPRWTYARRLAVACELLPRLQLEPLITHRVPFAQAAEAYRLIDEHPESAIQVVLTYTEPAEASPEPATCRT